MAVKTKKFMYHEKERDLFEMLCPADDCIGGVELNQMPEKEKEGFLKIVEQLDPFIRKYYRKFKKEEIK
jgi:hypothetical protein